MRPSDHSLQRRELQVLGHRIGQHRGEGDAYSGPGWQGDPLGGLRDEERERGQLKTIPEGWNREKNASGRVSAYVVSFHFWGSREGSRLHKGGNKMQFVYVADQERKQEAH